MVTPLSPPEGAVAGGSLFAGVDVAEFAGLRWTPGADRPRFEQDTWSFQGWADASMQMRAAEKRWQFGLIRNPRWRTVAKELALAWLHPADERVVILPAARRTACHPRTCHSRLFHLTFWFNWLTDRGISNLAEVGQHEVEVFLRDYSEIKDADGNVLRAKKNRTLVTIVKVIQSIADYAPLLSADRYRDDFRPWGARTPGRVLGTPCRPPNSTPPLPDEVLHPVLSAALYIVDTLGPHLLDLLNTVAEQRTRVAGLRRNLPPGMDQVLPVVMARLLVREYVEPNRPLPELDTGSIRRRLRERGWSPEDPLLRVNFTPLANQLGAQRLTGPEIELVRPSIRAALDQVGLAPPWCRDAPTVARADDGTLVPWSEPRQGGPELDGLRWLCFNAALIAVAALTGMRNSELMELTIGGRHTEQVADDLARHYLHSKVVKGRRWGGEPDEWVVVEQAYRAAEFAERLAAHCGRPTEHGAALFGRFSSFRHGLYAHFRDWVNDPAGGGRLGLAPIPDHPVTLRALRRTLALELAARPGGVIAAKVALKHISISTTEGYSHRPDGAQAVFHAEWKAAAAKENLRSAVEAFREFQAGQMPAGPGAARLVETFTAVDAALAEQARANPSVVDSDRQVELLLKAKAATLHPGAANYCWFDDPSQALCLKLAGVTEASTPLAGMCDSARCPQATHHAQHRPVWVTIADNTSELLDSRRIPAGEKHRLKAEHQRARAVIDQIDRAAGDDGSR